MVGGVMVFAAMQAGVVLAGTEMAGQPAIAVAEQRDPRLSDEILESRIEKSLRLDERIDWRRLRVEVDEGIATLLGQVKTPEEKGLAARVVTSVPGVKAVMNKILVQPNLPDDLAPGDAHIEEQTRDRVIESPGPTKDRQIMP